MTLPLESQIRALQARVDELSARLASVDTDAEDLAKVAMQDLSAALEELYVASEEQATQTEGLLQAQHRAELERRYFEHLFDAGPAASLITDSAARISAANEPAASLLGVETRFLSGKPLSVYLDAESQPALFRLMERAQRLYGETCRADLTLRSREGRSVLVTAIVCAALAGDGSTEYRLVLDEGITSRRFETLTATEREIRSASIRFDAIVEAASDGMVSVDEDQRIILFNRAAQQLLGWSAQEVVGQPLTTILPEAISDRHIGLVEGFSQEASVSRRMGERPTLRAVRKNGETFPAEITISRVRVDDRWISTAIIRDVTERDKASEELRFAEQFNRQIIDTIGALVVVSDPEGHILVFNHACERATGFGFEDVVGRDLLETLIPEEERPEVRGVLTDLVERGAASTHANDWLTADGGRRHIRWSNTAVLAESGELTHVIGTGIDVTHELELEQQIVSAQRLEMLGQLTGGIAHDFNNALAIMHGHLELLYETEGLPPAARSRVASIGAALKRAEGVVANLTTLSRPVPDRSAVIALNQTTESLGELMSEVLGHDVVLELELRASRNRVVIDPTRFEQVLLNLVLNVCDAMSGHGRVTITSTSTASSEGTPGVLLTVADTGKGMDSATLARAFEPFFTTKHPGAGTGVGLATAKLIVESAGGAIWAESTADAGTIVFVWFPTAEAEDDEPTALARTAGSSRHRSPATILVVDDEPELLELAREMLEVAGYRVLTATSAEAAKAVAESEGAELDVLLTDVVLPGDDGVTLANAIEARLPHVGIVFMTAHPEAVPAIADSREEPSGILRKPFDRDQLLTAVAATA